MKFDIEDIKKNYNRASVESWLESASREKERLEEFILCAAQQLRKIEETKFRHVVYFERRKDYDGKIWYYVGLKRIPDIPDGANTYYEVVGAERFPGKERKRAKEYAHKLVREYSAEWQDGVEP